MRNRAALLNEGDDRIFPQMNAPNAESAGSATARPPAGPVTGLVIVAAGRGDRAGRDGGPKQYRPLAGRALIARTLDAFEGFVAAADTCVVIHADDGAAFAEAVGADHGLLTVHGGAARQDSVRAGLEALAAARPRLTHVMIHDAARPFVPPALLRRIDAAVRAHPAGGVLPVLPVAETIKRVRDGLVGETVPREGLFAAQTPQTFPLDAILAVHRRAAAEGRTDFTDDAALFEWAGLPVAAIASDGANVKLTYAQDFEMAERRLGRTAPAPPDIRTGNGYDVHRFGPGDHVTLCGVAIPHGRALCGHSDADVGLHALTDALLATCGAGDIGDHFPPSDPQWRGQASSLFVEHAAQLVRRAGGTILNADISLIAEAPKIGPHRQDMRAALARLLTIDVGRCSVKATTNEQMGFVGRAEGIAAIATASVAYAPVEKVL